MSAENFSSTMSGNWSIIMSVTMMPSCVGFSDFPSLSTYPLSMTVDMVGAYVDGRPIPFSSSFLIRDASVYLAGGWVNFWEGFISSFSSCVSSLSGGSTTGCSFFSSVETSYSLVNPSKATVYPLARKI